MQVVSFDFWGWLSALFSLFWTCNIKTTASENHIKLNMPQQMQEGVLQEESYAKLATKLTLILLKDGSAFAYEGLDMSKGSVYNKKSLRNVILSAKKRFPSSEFIVLIKPSSQTDYSSTVDVLDEMVINKIDRYAIVKLTSEEAAKLNVTDGRAS